ncbi:hypothetical protein U0070_012504 [Myodes glareolus]|uniref:Uncharacterized protein n=1 Tax=Myodes glareolus TaxID=447135 RepID=A0AAW0HKX3_MYOGA
MPQLDKELSESPESPWCPILTQTKIQQDNKFFRSPNLCTFDSHLKGRPGDLADFCCGTLWDNGKTSPMSPLWHLREPRTKDLDGKNLSAISGNPGHESCCLRG